MSNSILVIGESGTGKSASLRNLEPAETFIINVLGKPLPFPGWKKKYTVVNKDTNPEGNLYKSDNAMHIDMCIKSVSANKPTIKNLIIDDFQYVMCNEYMRRASEKGFEKFTEIGKNAWGIVKTASEQRDDLNIIFLSHSEESETGKVKMKTIGKMLDNTVTVEGMFTLVLRTIVQDGAYMFTTQNNGRDTVKTPMGMFSESVIENDMNLVLDRVKEYEGGQ